MFGCNNEHGKITQQVASNLLLLIAKAVPLPVRKELGGGI
jgi:hypothetical protein